MATKPLESGDEQQQVQRQHDRPPRPLLAPIVLNTSNSSGKKRPNPIPHLEPSPMLRTRSTPVSPTQLIDMEPPPPIPAAIEEQGYRSRPSSQHSIRWKDCSDDEGVQSDGGGYKTPGRPSSAATESTTAWELSPGGESVAGPSNSARGRRRRGGFFNAGNHSGSSFENAYAYDGTATAARANRPSGDYSTGDETEIPLPAKKQGFFSRLRNFGSGNGVHGRSQSGWTIESVGDSTTPIGPFSPVPYSPAVGGAPDEDEELEDTDHTMGGRSVRSATPEGSRTAPGTPRAPHGPRRRATVTNIPEEAGTQSDRGYSSRRASFRRITQFNHRRSHDGGESLPTTPMYGSGWRALKAGLKMMGQRKKEESRVDREKSAELVAELTAATPAAVILASMFQRDEHGNKRIPILLEQLKVKIVDSNPTSKGAGRAHTTFRIELEYGSGLTRMKWVIHREFRDFVNLHSRYRLADISNTTFGGRDAYKLPKFPRATIPYLRGVRGLGSEDDSESENSGAEATAAGDGAAAVQKKKRRPHIRRMSSNFLGEHAPQGIATGIAAGLGTLTAPIGAPGSTQNPRKEGFAIRQRQQLEDYLRSLIRIMIFRPDSNRLCKFLELSALGVRLAAEGSYHGKEGYLIIRSSKGSDYRRAWNPSAVAKRHSPKWFLVRHSYIVCVDSPEEMNIYDVFLVDSKFMVNAKKSLRKKPQDMAITNGNPARPQHHSLVIQNSERTLKLLAKHERQLGQFTESIKFMRDNTDWAKPQRFEAYAPVRTGVFAQWLVDGRDYMWNVSRAISMAKDVIYIHDWWLSPELYLRRPAAVSQKWRLDRLLQRKAQEGVKIFVIIYRNIGAAIPIDSTYSKYSLLDLHPNVFVQRSPNQIRQATFFWAHHEKILIVDHMVAFVGGLDLCFGRWDTPQHSLVDDKPTGFEEGSNRADPDSFQLWPGKDYSNPRVQDFYSLDKPYEEMYDRSRVPRMPWHDIHMQVVGQPARDLTRHFVQRWNYLLRQRTPSRPTPVLLPPPDFTQAELESLGIDGTCEVQILRSASSWSLGTPSTTECSIMNAYIKSIELSEHFVYIENQFFITSTEWEGTKIENKIGDALVERIIRAYNNDEDWRAIILIPLMPGFQNTVDSQDGTSVRLIMQCQYRSISRGEYSIFGRLRAHGIEPEEFIQFFGLRNWGKIGPEKALVTEQLYIHAKCMIVDDRIAIIGSANINERSMLGHRDSEVATIVRDTDTTMSSMAGKPFRVGKFPHTLRLRLMREHLGIDVDELMACEHRVDSDMKGEEWEEQIREWSNQGDGADEKFLSQQHRKNGSVAMVTSKLTLEDEAVLRQEELRSFNHDVDWEQENNPHLKTRKRGTTDNRITGNQEHRNDVKGYGPDNMHARARWGTPSTVNEKVSEEMRSPVSPPPVTIRSPTSETVRPSAEAKSPIEGNRQNLSSTNLSSPASSYPRNSTISSSRASSSDGPGNANLPPPPGPERVSSVELGLPQLSQLPPLPVTSDQDIGGPFTTRPVSVPGEGPPVPLLDTMEVPKVEPDMFMDPLNESFYQGIWNACAQNNTKIYRQVFRCMPDNEVKTWAAYKEYAAYGERFSQSQGVDKSKMRRQQETPGKSGPPGADLSGIAAAIAVPGEKLGTLGDKVGEKVGAPVHDGNSHLPQGNVKDWAIPTVQSQDELNRVVGGDAMGEKSEHPPIHKSSRPRSTSLASSRLNTAVTAATTSTTAGAPNSSHSHDSSEKKLDPNLLSSGAGSISYSSNTNLGNGGSTKRRRRGTTRSSKRDFHASEPLLEKDVAEQLLNLTQGHLVVWPHEWLSREEEGGNWLYSIDQLAPIEIYN
ncbi:phospholipase D [Choiromyces venosus 120613-1]|uniref:Phospholipase n=1 Tax=Choiromyces venosus 120613-1 TaxID=1336337 RepID=A0A3N4JS39_9PEZI|nr:phospholipase D [Choiromyces venosus 120613-1]